MFATLLLFFHGALAEAPTTPEATGPGIALDVFLDVSSSTHGHAAQDLALVEHLAGVLGPEDTLAVTAFDGVPRPLIPAGPPPTNATVEAALHGLAYTGKVTFYTAALNSLAATHDPARARVALIVTDAAGSDPTNLKHRPAVADPNWTTAPVAFLGDTQVVWLVRGKAAPAVTPGAFAGAITEPSGLASTAVVWTPYPNWSSPGEDIAGWVESFRPVPAPVPLDPPLWPRLRPIVEWAGAGVVGLALLVLALTRGIGAARRAAQHVASQRQERRTQQMLDDARASQGALRLEPLAVDGDVEERTVRASDVIEVGRLAAWPGIPWALPGGGFTLRVGTGPRDITVAPRGTRSAIAIARSAGSIDVELERPEVVHDGDVIVDGRSGQQLVRVRIAEPLRRAV